MFCIRGVLTFGRGALYLLTEIQVSQVRDTFISSLAPRFSLIRTYPVSSTSLLADEHFLLRHLGTLSLTYLYLTSRTVNRNDLVGREASKQRAAWQTVRVAGSVQHMHKRHRTKLSASRLERMNGGSTLTQTPGEIAAQLCCPLCGASVQGCYSLPALRKRHDISSDSSTSQLLQASQLPRHISWLADTGCSWLDN